MHPLISRIAFGSCQTQDEPLPILRTVLEWEPELFIYLGDNIYGDTNDMAVLEAKYAKMGCEEEGLQSTASQRPYDRTLGRSRMEPTTRARQDYPFRKESKDIFLKFWNEPNPSAATRTRWHLRELPIRRQVRVGKTLQIILLDTRSFRDPPLVSPLTSWKNDYLPDTDPTKTILGDVQWKWLEERF